VSSRFTVHTARACPAVFVSYCLPIGEAAGTEGEEDEEEEIIYLVSD